MKLVRKINPCGVLMVSKDAAVSCYFQSLALNRTSLMSFRPKCADCLDMISVWPLRYSELCQIVVLFHMFQPVAHW